MNISWLDKYRPSNITSLNTHENIINTLNIMKTNNCVPNLLCYGPPGSGKTLTMTIFGNCLYEQYAKLNIMTINASDERGISTIRDKISKFIDARSLFTTISNEMPRKMVIMDEADYMTEDAQYAITNIMDEHPDILFVFICNYIYKIHESIHSRCLTLHFRAIPVKNMKTIVSSIVSKEQMNISDSAIQLICELTHNDMRSGMYMLQSMNHLNKRITPKNIYSYYQYPTASHIHRILSIVKEQNISSVYSYIVKLLHDSGIRVIHIVNELYTAIVSNISVPKDILRDFIVQFAELEYNLTYEHTNEILIGNIACCLWLIKEYL